MQLCAPGFEPRSSCEPWSSCIACVSCETTQIATWKGALAKSCKCAVTTMPCLRREVFFETNGVPRMVEVEDRQQSAAAEGGGAAAGKPVREKADPVALGSVGCPMSGQVIEVVAKPGAFRPDKLLHSYGAPSSRLICHHTATKLTKGVPARDGAVTVSNESSLVGLSYPDLRRRVGAHFSTSGL